MMTNAPTANTPRALRLPVSDEMRVLLVSVGVMLVAALLAVIFLPPTLNQRASITNEGQGGAYILKAWLERGGYQTQRITSDPLDPAAYDVLFVLAPIGGHDSDEIQAIAKWVRDGGRLIVASTDPNVNGLLGAFGMTVNGGQYVYTTGLTLTAPTLTHPPISNVSISHARPLSYQRAETVVHLAVEQTPVLVSLNEGRGQVFVIGTVYPFTNEGLHDDGAQQLVANLLHDTRPGSTVIGFDEAQIAGTGSIPPSLTWWMLRTPAGLGITLTWVLLLAYLLSRGRRLGAPVPLVQDRLRREPVEYIVAMANLFRRSGRRANILAHYKSRLRRRLSERYALDPALPNEALARQAAARDPQINEAELLALLQRLSKPRVSEAELLNTVSAAEEWAERMGRRTIT